MKLTLENLPESLKKELSPVYLISSNEPLLSMRAIDQIRGFATSKGFVERRLYTIGPRFDWSIIEADLNNLSLFSSQKIIEIRIGSESVGINGSNAIKKLLEKLNQDTLLLISSDKIDFKFKFSEDKIEFSIARLDKIINFSLLNGCLLYTSPSPRD